MMELILIRHGKTRANEQHLYCGSTDLPLSEAGAQALKEKDYAPGTGRYITSGMRRTEQTLELLFGPVEHEIDSRFREVDFGSFEMHSYEQLRENPEYQAWITGDNEGNVPPGGESGAEMTRRVLAAYWELEARGENAVVVTHGGVIAAILAELFPGEGRNRYQWQPRPGAGYRIRIEEAGRSWQSVG